MPRHITNGGPIACLCRQTFSTGLEKKRGKVESHRPAWVGKRDDDVCIVNTDGTGFATIVGGENVELCPRWSPDGSRILYTPAPRLGGCRKAESPAAR